MADYVMLRKGRDMLSSVVHVLLNIALAVVSTALTVISGSWIISVVLVFLSKWRVFAVRPRYWWLNVKANLVDYVVSLSLVALVYLVGVPSEGVSIWHIVFTVIYAAWLVIIKPRSKAVWTEVQSFCAVFFGTWVITLLTARSTPLISTFCAFAIGFSAARHILIQGEDHDFTFATFIFGLIMAELNWVFYHWMIVYRFPGATVDSFGLPQVSIVSALLGFVFLRGYKSALYHDGKIRSDDIVMPAIFSILVLVMMLVFFSEPMFNV